MVNELLSYFRSCGRDLVWRRDRDPYKILLSEVMLQQTRIAAVIPYFERFLAEVPDVEHLASLSDERLMKLWEGLGYYSRARNLKKAAQKIVENGHFPDTYEEILALPGVGEYTAGAIASIAFNLPTPAVDGNVLRVLSRFHARDFEKKEANAYLETVYPKGHCGDFTQAIMELGEMICLPHGTPRCDVCPLQEECRSLQENKVSEFPHPKAKKARRVEEKIVLLAQYGKRIALLQRPNRGLLANLWSFPDTGNLTLKEFLTENNLKVRSCQHLGKAKHIFTHIEWVMQAVKLDLSERPSLPDWKFVTLSELEEDYALPSAYRPILTFFSGGKRK